MPDKEKVMNALERCEPYELCVDDSCPYFREATCLEKLRQDTLDLLKEQEAVKPCVAGDTWICPKCGHVLESQDLIDDKENPQVLVHEQYNFCPDCGIEVKWE